jgi:hypothetical protein
MKRETFHAHVGVGVDFGDGNAMPAVGSAADVAKSAAAEGGP